MTRTALATFLICGFTLCAVSCLSSNSSDSSENGEATTAQYIDIHNHLFARVSETERDYEGAAELALEAMDNLGIQKMFLMPPPFTPSQGASVYDADDLTDTVAANPDRFAFLAGGGSLNVMIQQAVAAGETSAEMLSQFQETAEEIFSKGALGFGEMTAEHFSLGTGHVYESAPPDHTLFLALANIAANNNVPIDIHMEAIPEAMSLPEGLSSPPNPEQLTPNIAAFETLLDHNPDAKIIWSHVGWDNSGQRTSTLCDELLGNHANLYMSIKVGEDNLGGNRVVDEDGNLKSEWLDLFTKYPDRFLIGSDQFYVSPQIDQQFPSHVQQTTSVLSQIPTELANKIGYENAQSLFNLDE